MVKCKRSWKKNCRGLCRRRSCFCWQWQKEIIEITIKPEAVDPDDVEMLQDLIMAAVNEATRKADEMAQAEMGKLTGGMGMPGLF